MLCCIHNGFHYCKGLYQDWNSEEAFNFFDKYNLLEDDFEDLGTCKFKVRYFRKEFVDTFTEEDWYLSSLEEEAREFTENV